MGDSVRGSLRKLALRRLGPVTHVLITSQLLDESVPARLKAQPSFPAGADALPMLTTRGRASALGHNAAGVQILAGTDAIGRQTPFLHAELQLLVRQAGLTPLQAIRAATLNGATALGLQDSTGTVQANRWADLIVLRADPSKDIRNTQTVRYVLRGGVVHERTMPWVAVPGEAAGATAPPRAR